MRNMDREIEYNDSSLTNRVEVIDALKGIGILLMVLGHMHFSVIFNHYIFAFHMPLFFLISGYLYKRPQTMLKTIIRKAKRLLIPYFSFGIGYWILWLIANGKKTENPFYPLWALLFHGIDGLAIESALWFLPTLFVTYMLFAVINRQSIHIACKATLIASLTLIGCITTGMLYTSKNMGGGIAVPLYQYLDLFIWDQSSVNIRIF